MTHGLVASLTLVIVAVISDGGYLGIALLMAIESACLPLPSEIIMPFAGYLVHTGRFNLLLVATAGALGCNLGSAVAYAVGAHGGRPLLERYGRWLLVGPDELDQADRFFARFGAPAVFVGRLLPVVRTFIALPAGVARMSQLRFHVYTFLGSWPFCFALAFVGMKLGERWDNDPALRALFHRFDTLVILLAAACLAWYVWWRWPGRRWPGRRWPGRRRGRKIAENGASAPLPPSRPFESKRK
jgi:membrane protein DedA with SNARE-associated domain